MIENEIKQVDFILNVIQDMNMFGDTRYRAVITVRGEAFHFQYHQI